MKRRLVTALLMALSTTLFYAVPVLAIGAPDSDPTVSNIHVNRNLLVTGDVLIYGDYFIPYAAIPTEPAGDTYIISVIEDGVGEVGSVTPYSAFFEQNGYNHGVFGLYFDDDITWGNAYTIRIAQSPAYFATPLYWDNAISSSSYTAMTDQESNQAELTLNIISAAERLEVAYPDETILESGPDGTVLASPDGENYFRGAINGIQYMAPSLFYIQQMTNDVEPQTWTTAQFDTYEARFAGTWAGDEADATATQWGSTTQATMAFFFTLPLAGICIFLGLIKFKKAESGYMASMLVILMGTMMGWFPTAILASIYQLCAIYLSFVLFFMRG